MTSYQLRKKGTINYQEANVTELPRAKRVKRKEKLHDLEVVAVAEDHSSGKVKVEGDEKKDIVITKQPQPGKLLTSGLFWCHLCSLQFHNNIIHASYS